MTRLGDILKALADKPASNAADYIVERGEKNGWTYEKWASGFAVARKSVVLNEPINSSWGQFNINPNSADFEKYPFTFVDKPFLSATAWTKEKSLISIVTESAEPKNYGPFVLAGRPAGQYIDNAIDITFQATASGRWK